MSKTRKWLQRRAETLIEQNAAGGNRYEARAWVQALRQSDRTLGPGPRRVHYRINVRADWAVRFPGIELGWVCQSC